MSRVSQMASMWQSKKIQQQANIVPPKAQQPNPVQPQKQPPVVSSTANKIQFAPIAKKIESTQETRIQETKQVEMPRQSVAQLRKNLQIKLGPVGLMGLTRALQVANMPSKKQPNATNEQQFKKMVLQNDNVVKNQRIPTFIQSKARLQNMFQKKVTQKEGYHTGPPGQNSQGGYINLGSANDVQNVTPEERTQQIMKRIFSAPQTQKQPCFVIEKQKKQQTKSQTGQQQQIKNLNLRAPKKQKKDLGNFDDF